MKRKKGKLHSRTPIVLVVLLLALFGLIQGVLGAGIDPNNRWAWSTSAGWINFAPLCTGCDGVVVYADHLEGYAWGEHIGWIRVGSYDGGGAHTYANTTADNYGVNNDGAGHLSGYAWGTNVGWINFDPAGSEQVTIDPTTAEFDGYAWGENVGWIHFRGTGQVEYGVSLLIHHIYLPLVLKNA
jgi:hypothetical protein